MENADEMINGLVVNQMFYKEKNILFLNFSAIIFFVCNKPTHHSFQTACCRYQAV